MSSAFDKLLQLVGWSSSDVPRDKPRRSDELNQMQSQFGHNPYGAYANTVKPPYERRRKYDIYDEMDELEIISSVLDAYAEDCTQNDREKQASVWIEAENPEVKKILDSLFDRLNVQEMIESIIRDTAKYGDDFAELDIEDKIVGWDWRDPRDIERIENRQGTLVGFEETVLLKDIVPLLDGTAQTTLLQNTGTTNNDQDIKALDFSYKPWDMVHFRLYRRKREFKQKFRNIYGTSMLSGSERISKQVKILDDMLMVRRLTKTLDTRVYHIDTARSSTEEEVQILKRWRNALKRRPFIDPSSGRMDTPFDPFTWQEDVFWPAKEGNSSKVEVIPGQPNVADIVDVEHFTNKMFGSLRAPKAYFGLEGDVNCLAGETKVMLLNGREVEIKDLVGKDGTWIITTGEQRELMEAKAYDIRLSGYVTDIYEVHLDNGQVVRATGEHRFVRDNFENVHVVDLVPGDKLLATTQRVEHRRVVKVEKRHLTESIPVYDLSVESSSELFALSAGIFVHNSKATLSTQDMKWGRACNAIQRAVKNGLERVCRIELALHNLDAMKAKFRVGMVVPSVLEELSRLEAMQMFVDIAERMIALGEHLQLNPDRWREHVLKSIMGMPMDDVERYTRQPEIEPLPALPGSSDEPPQNPEPAKDAESVLMEGIMSSYLIRYGVTSERGITEKIRECELPMESTGGKDSPISFDVGKLLKLSLPETVHEAEFIDDETDDE